MGRVSGAVHGQVLSRDCEACQSSGVPRAKVGSDDSDGLRRPINRIGQIC